MPAAIIIPARLESTRLANKLLLDETGLPLVCHTVLAAARVRDRAGDRIGAILVAADSPRIVDAVEAFSRERKIDVRAVMTDPGHQSGSDRIAEVAAGLPADIDAVLNLQGDEPEIDAADVSALLDAFDRASADIATLAYPVASPSDRANPDLVKVVLGRDGRALYFSRADIPYRRADGPFAPPSYGHVGIYLYRRSALERFVGLPQGALEQTEKLEQLRALENGMAIVVHVLATRPPKGIDTPQDYADFVRRFTAFY